MKKPLQEEDIQRLRAETKGTQHVIHFNNAGAALMPDAVSQAVIEYIQAESRKGGYETARHYRRELGLWYDYASQMIGSHPEEVVFMESATTAWHAVFQSISFQPGDEIITSMAEYASNYIAFLRRQKETGFKIRVVPNDEHGRFSTAGLKELINEKTRLIALTHMPTNGGLVNPAEEVGDIAREHNILYLLDACQSLGQYPLDVKKLKCDYLSATGRKYLRAPRGTGLLYVRKDILPEADPLVIDLHGASWKSDKHYEPVPNAKRFETFEHSFASMFGMQVAMKYALDIGMEAIWQRVQFIANQLRAGLDAIPGVKTYDLGKEKSGIVTFYADAADARTLIPRIGKQGFNVSLVFRDGTLLDMDDRKLPEMIRASVHYYNTGEEIECFVTKLETLLSEFKTVS
jgi:cysteine desulfurase / selenocysteine lyase